MREFEERTKRYLDEFKSIYNSPESNTDETCQINVDIAIKNLDQMAEPQQ